MRFSLLGRRVALLLLTSTLACGHASTGGPHAPTDDSEEEGAPVPPRASTSLVPLEEHAADCKLVDDVDVLLDGEPTAAWAASEVPDSPEARDAAVKAIDRALAGWDKVKTRLEHDEVRAAAAYHFAGMKKRRAQLQKLVFVKVGDATPATENEPARPASYQVDANDFVDTRGAFYDTRAPIDSYCKDRRPIG